MSDPYEEQLLAVFESCDVKGTGQLDYDGLTKLCDQLHLEEGKHQLMQCLLPTFTFEQFRDALLALLGSSRSHSDEDREPSPEREVSPKFVFGQKKYGRRSRPESAEQESDSEANDFDSSKDLEDNDIFLPLDDKEKNKSKPSSLLIGDCQSDRESAVTPTSVHSVAIDKEEVESPRRQGETELRLAAQRLGLGDDGFVDASELASVCRAVGMEKMADEVVKQVFSKLEVDGSGRISFAEFLQLFRSTQSTAPHTDCQPLSRTPPLYHQSNLTSLDVFSSGCIGCESLLELWESGGVVNAAGLLSDLGLSPNTDLSLSALSTTFEEEIRSLANKSVSSPSPQVNLLTAAFILAQVQLKFTKSCLEQITGERDKLHVDLAESNQRATLLAQEVDDRHARMERASQMQIKVLEKRHAEQVKQLTQQLGTDRDHLTSATLRLEKKLSAQQEEEAKLRTSLQTLKAEFEAIEKENHNLSEKLMAYEVVKNKSERDYLEIQKLQQKVQELEASNDQVPSLLQQLGSLQTENTTLRDRNDELTIQIENLSVRPICKRQNSCTSLEGGVGGGTKRRGNSPLALTTEHSWDEESPRLGKVRRFCTDPDLSLESVPMEGLAIGHTLHHSESGLEADLDTLDDSYTISSPSLDKITFQIGRCVGVDSEMSELEQLRSTVANLQRENQEFRKKLAVTVCNNSSSMKTDELANEDHKLNYSMDTESTEVQTSLEASTNVNLLEKRCHELTSTLKTVQTEILKILSEKKACNEENCALKQKIVELNETLPVSKTLNDNHEVVENSSGPLTFTISYSPESQMHNENMLTVLNNKLEESPNNTVLNSFPRMNYAKNDPDVLSLIPTENKEVDVFENRFVNLSKFAFELSQSLSNPKLTGDFFSTNLDCEQLSSNVKEGSSTLTDVKDDTKMCDIEEGSTYNLTEQSDKLLKENTEMKTKCVELEKSLELMRVEFEKCEDYWQEKLNEERAIFDQEQRLSDEKFAELEIKIQEYAELFGSESCKTINHLPTIDERDSLERQVTDLEEEFEEYKRVSKMEIKIKSEQIKNLQFELQRLQEIVVGQGKDSQDIGIQVSERPYEFRLHQPNSNPHPKINIPVVEVSECCCSCHTNLTAREREEVVRLRNTKQRLQTECDVLHRRRQQLIMHQLSHHTNPTLIYPPMHDRRLASDVEMFHNLSSRLRHQELRCRHLQSALKHHQRQTDKLVQNAWDQYKADLSSVQRSLQNTQDKLQHQTKLCKLQMERLTASDVLVKDLYKENAHLSSLVQKLEEQNLFVDQSIR